MVTGLTHPLHFFFQGKRLESKREKERWCQYWYLDVLVSLMLIGSLRLHKAVHYHAHTGLPIPLQHTAQLERNKLGSTQADGLAASGTAFCSTTVSDLKVTALPHTTTTPEKAALSAVY